MKKIISLLLAMAFTVSASSAESLHKTLSALGVNKSAVAIYIKDVKSGNVVFSMNEKAPMLPASTLKIITSSAAVDTLGADYKYETKLYKSTNNDLYLKLSGDPLLESSDLDKLIESANSKSIVPKTFYVDDSAFDKTEWGEGWQWDDSLNPLMPKFSSYNINKNLLKVEVTPTSQGASAKLTVKPFYPLTFMNLVTTDTTTPTSVSIDSDNTIAPNMLNIFGTVSKLTNVILPVPNARMNFILRLENSINSKKMEYYGAIKNAKLPDKNVYLVDEIEHPIEDMLPLILRNSNNFVAETLFKSAGAKWVNSQGSIKNSLGMLSAYFDKNGLNSDDIKIVDGSGVSKNNIMTAEFMGEFLEYKSKTEDFECFKELLPTAGEGTLKNRMLYFKDNLRAKTGTLADTSAIAGYITSRKGKLYAFDIMINDAKTSPADKKNIEEQILRSVYANY